MIFPVAESDGSASSVKKKYAAMSVANTTGRALFSRNFLARHYMHHRGSASQEKRVTFSKRHDLQKTCN